MCRHRYSSALTRFWNDPPRSHRTPREHGGGGVAGSGGGAARARQADRLLTGFSEPEFLPLADAFTKRMAELGWTDRQDTIIDVRTAAGDYTRLTNEAGELVSSKVDLIVAMGTPG